MPQCNVIQNIDHVNIEKIMGTYDLKRIPNNTNALISLLKGIVLFFMHYLIFIVPMKIYPIFDYEIKLINIFKI